MYYVIFCWELWSFLFVNLVFTPYIMRCGITFIYFYAKVDSIAILFFLIIWIFVMKINSSVVKSAASETVGNQPCWIQGPRTCYMCGSPDHFIRDCPAALSQHPMLQTGIDAFAYLYGGKIKSNVTYLGDCRKCYISRCYAKLYAVLEWGSIASCRALWEPLWKSWDRAF